MLAIVGLSIILLVIFVLLTGRVSPVVALTLVPLGGALLAGFGASEISAFYTQGLAKVAPVAAMFIFAILFFGVLQDAGLFRPILGGLIRLTGGNVVAVAIGTALVGMLAHLDGAGATTFLLTIPALLPLYKRLRMSPYLMLMLIAIGAGIFNMLPWGGPLGRAAAVTGLDVTELWHPLIPLQAAGAVLLVAFAGLMGVRERGRIKRDEQPTDEISKQQLAAASLQPTAEEAALERPRFIWANGLILLGVLALLVQAPLPAAYIFMIGLAIALPFNYRSVDEQMARVNAHAPNALMMGAIIFAAGSFLGVLDGSGMLTSIAQLMAGVLPEALLPRLHLIFGVVGLPMELLLNTDAYYFGFLPIVQEIVAVHGVPPAEVVYALMIGNIVGTFISPFSPALWLALGLAGLDMGRHIRYSLLWMWGFSVALFVVAIGMGIVSLA